MGNTSGKTYYSWFLNNAFSLQQLCGWMQTKLFLCLGSHMESCSSQLYCDITMNNNDTHCSLFHWYKKTNMWPTFYYHQHVVMMPQKKWNSMIKQLKKCTICVKRMGVSGEIGAYCLNLPIISSVFLSKVCAWKHHHPGGVCWWGGGEPLLCTRPVTRGKHH